MAALHDVIFQFMFNEKRRILEQIKYCQERYEAQKQQAQVLSRILQRPVARTRDMAYTEREISELQERLKQIEERLSRYKEAHKTTSASSSRVQKALQTLGLPVNCNDAEKIKEAYRKLAKQHHPDAGGDAKTMARINEAYQIASEYAKA